jgi:hypothetical protein
MKNLPTDYYPPMPLAPKDVRHKIVERNSGILHDVIGSFEKSPEALQSVLGKFPENLMNLIIGSLPKPQKL